MLILKTIIEPGLTSERYIVKKITSIDRKI